MTDATDCGMCVYEDVKDLPVALPRAASFIQHLTLGPSIFLDFPIFESQFRSQPSATTFLSLHTQAIWPQLLPIRRIAHNLRPASLPKMRMRH
jgi:hypothetical protein